MCADIEEEDANISVLSSGPAGAFWGYIVVMLGCISTYATLAELASMSPTAGGVYFWVAMLAPVRCQKFLSYTTGLCFRTTRLYFENLILMKVTVRMALRPWVAGFACSNYLDELTHRGFLI